MITVRYYSPTGWHDISHKVRAQSITRTRTLMSQQRKSVVDTCRFSINHDQTLYDHLIETTNYTVVEMLQDGQPYFYGAIPPALSQRDHYVLDAIELEVIDNSYLLEKEVISGLQMPTDITDEGWYILSFSQPEKSILHSLFALATYNKNTCFDATQSEILTKVRIVYAGDSQKTFRQIIDPLLFEYGYVLTTNEAGQFKIVNWDPDTISETEVIKGVGLPEGLEMNRQESFSDGVAVEWTRAEVLEDMLVYRDRLPVNTEVGSDKPLFPGKPIGADMYYPTNGDVAEIYFNYTIDALDIPYVKKNSRLKNEDLALLGTSNCYAVADMDPDLIFSIRGFQVDRARILLQNTGTTTQKLYQLAIRGDVLIRTDRITFTTPTDSRKPTPYTSEYIFDEAKAKRLMENLASMQSAGLVTYCFPHRDKFLPGEIIRLQREPTKTDTMVLVTRVIDQLDRPVIKYESVAISGHQTAAYAHRESRVSDSIATLVEQGQASERPTTQQIVDGVDSNGAAIPATPTLAAIANQRTVNLSVGKQTDIVSASLVYQYQISMDKVNCYSLGPGGANSTDWQGIQDETTEAPTNSYTHTSLPLGGTASAPEPRIYHYRVRAKNNNGESPWSNWATVTVEPFFQVDLATGCVTVEKLDLDSIFASEITIKTGGMLKSADGAVRLDNTGIIGPDFTLTAAQKVIGGWQFTATGLRSDNLGNARMEMSAAHNRFEVWGAAGAEPKVAMGYLGGLSDPANRAGTLASNVFGFWTGQGDTLEIQGEMALSKGQFVIASDASIDIRDSEDDPLLRFGTDAGNKGLFWYKSVAGADNNALHAAVKYHSTGLEITGDRCYVASDLFLTSNKAYFGASKNAGLYLYRDEVNGKFWIAPHYHGAYHYDKKVGFNVATESWYSEAAFTIGATDPQGNMLHVAGSSYLSGKLTVHNDIVMSGITGQSRQLALYNNKADHSVIRFLINDGGEAGNEQHNVWSIRRDNNNNLDFSRYVNNTWAGDSLTIYHDSNDVRLYGALLVNTSDRQGHIARFGGSIKIDSILYASSGYFGNGSVITGSYLELGRDLNGDRHSYIDFHNADKADGSAEDYTARIAQYSGDIDLEYYVMNGGRHHFHNDVRVPNLEVAGNTTVTGNLNVTGSMGIVNATKLNCFVAGADISSLTTDTGLYFHSGKNQQAERTFDFIAYVRINTMIRCTSANAKASFKIECKDAFDNWVVVFTKTLTNNGTSVNSDDSLFTIYPGTYRFTTYDTLDLGEIRFNLNNISKFGTTT